jgi:hypothetical protein
MPTADGSVRAVAFSDARTCALSSLGNLSCWGARGAVSANGVLEIAGAGERVCARTQDDVWCWRDASGEATAVEGLGPSAAIERLGVGRSMLCAASKGAPVRCITRGDPAVREVKAMPGAGVVDLTVGDSHACVALRSGGVMCWGENDRGQLGDGTNVRSDIAVAVAGLGDVAQIRAGASHTCARLRNDTVSCWGANDHHQLANGTTKPSTRPVPLFGIVGVREVAAGGDGACVRLGDGEVRCWGRNDRGQLGDGRTVEHDVPMPIRSPKDESPPSRVE